MTIWVFYSKDIAINVYNKTQLSDTLRQKLISDGFQKIDLEISAADEGKAIDLLLENYRANTEALKEFGKDVTFSSLIFNLLRQGS
ncbi:hypothetical protein HQN64_14945 [Enterobacteriaceae bacterium BIT-l23]|uniref:hypothetical protein n=1 Tax=Jejubacter sp. L23 TaxID=3092086 RepID=UPI0015853BF8|nr:hypothetical protein [Enterobacteriaceae bacterium BIT-l23]